MIQSLHPMSIRPARHTGTIIRSSSALRATLRRTVSGAAALSLLALAACDTRGNGPTESARDGVRLSLAASVMAAPGAVVEAIVSYTPPGQSPIVVGQDSIIVDTGAPNTPMTVRADVTACLAAATTPGTPCTLTVTVRLKRGALVLDEATRVVTVASGASDISISAVSVSEVSSVRIVPLVPAAFEPGDSLQFVATAVDRVGGTVAARNVVWSVTGSAATVSATGLVRAVAPGSATVRATVGGRVLDVPLTIGPSSVASLTISPADTTVFVGTVAAYTVVARSSSGAVLSGRTVTFTSLTPTVASVSPAGVASTLLAGLSTIRAQSTEGRGGATISATATLRVNPLIIAVSPIALSFDTEINQPLPPAQNVAVTSFNAGNVGTISVQTPIDTLLTATLNTSTAPATLTVRPTRTLAPGTTLTRTVVVRSTNPFVTSATVSVTLIGRTPVVQFGRFSGLVLNAGNGAPIGQATVTIRTTANVQVDQIVTGTDGRWTSVPLPAGTYNLTIATPGFDPVVLSNRVLVGGPSVPTTALPTVSLNSPSGVISGFVNNAVNGNAISGATVELRAGSGNISGAPLATATTNSDGAYEFTARPFGTYTIRVVRSGFADLNATVVLAGATVTAPAIFLSPAGQNVLWRFVLSWGSSPSDLDAHLTGPIPNSNTRFHVYFSNEGSLTTFPFALLDFDVTNGFGPETITISQQAFGVYRYYIDNFSEESPLRSSGARVDVYQGNTLVRQFSPPQQDGAVWTVFELNGTVITPIGTIGNTEPPIRAPGPRRADARVDASAEWYALSPWTWTKPGAGKRR